MSSLEGDQIPLYDVLHSLYLINCLHVLQVNVHKLKPTLQPLLLHYLLYNPLRYHLLTLVIKIQRRLIVLVILIVAADCAILG